MGLAQTWWRSIQSQLTSMRSQEGSAVTVSHLQPGPGHLLEATASDPAQGVDLPIARAPSLARSRIGEEHHSVTTGAVPPERMRLGRAGVAKGLSHETVGPVGDDVLQHHVEAAGAQSTADAGGGEVHRRMGTGRASRGDSLFGHARDDQRKAQDCNGSDPRRCGAGHHPQHTALTIERRRARQQRRIQSTFVKNRPGRGVDSESGFRTTEVHDCRQVEVLGRLQLVVGALTGALVRPPPQEARRVPEPITLELLESDFTYQLRTERNPGGVASLRPAARRAGRSSVAEAALTLIVMQELEQLSPLLRAERGGVADMMEVPLLVVQTEQERADSVAL